MCFLFFSLIFLKDCTPSITVVSRWNTMEYHKLCQKKTCFFLSSRFAYRKGQRIPNDGLRKTKLQKL